MDPTINLWRKAGKSRLLILLLHNFTILTLTICLILLYDYAVIVLLVPTSRDRRVQVVESKRGKLFRDATIIDLTDEDDQNDPIQPEILEVDLEEDNLSVTSL
jgi:hypothetical protein